MTDQYKAALHRAQAELAELEQRRTTLLRLIQNLKELSEDEKYELAPTPGYVPKGLTEEIRTVLELTTTPIDAVEIRDALVLRGVKYSSPKNLLINVHTVLDRIKEELETMDKDGKTAYISPKNKWEKIISVKEQEVQMPIRPVSPPPKFGEATQKEKDKK